MRWTWAALCLTACVANVDLGGPLRCAPDESPCATAAGPRCVSLDEHPDHCGACGNACAAAPSASPACAGGRCALRCDEGRGDCDGVASNGCEADLARDRFHCGACRARCERGRGCGDGRCDLANVALGATASQSSVYTAGMCDRAASIAVDGLLCGVPSILGGDDCAQEGCRTLSATQTADGAWWSVDLGRAREIVRVDTWSTSLNPQVVERSLDGASWTSMGDVPAVAPRPARTPVSGLARYVRLRSVGEGSVKLIETEVYAHEGGS